MITAIAVGFSCSGAQ
ncbi:hypothetical protein A2U01_0110714, partial [Trifolium medium]|nr:hypothetical protein [Trifolium medium]